MGIINLFTIIAFTVIVIIFFSINLKYKKYYISYIEVLDDKEFFLKHFFPLGLYILEKFRYQFSSGYDRKLLNSMSEIYGQEYGAFYLRIFHANKIVSTVIFIILTLISGVIFKYNTTVFVYLTIIYAIFIASDDLKLKNKVKMRRLEIRLQFPEFVNKLTLLLNAGLTMSKAWEKISFDSEQSGYFYSEISKTVNDIKSGKNETEAFGDFAKRVKTPEISRLMSAIIQNTKRGGNNLVMTLRLQSNECWEMRKNAVKRLGEEASTKLLLPMMLMFAAILVIVVTPAIISMQNI